MRRAPGGGWWDQGRRLRRAGRNVGCASPASRCTLQLAAHMVSSPKPSTILRFGDASVATNYTCPKDDGLPAWDRLPAYFASRNLCQSLSCLFVSHSPTRNPSSKNDYLSLSRRRLCGLASSTKSSWLADHHLLLTTNYTVHQLPLTYLVESFYI